MHLVPDGKGMYSFPAVEGTKHDLDTDRRGALPGLAQRATNATDTPVGMAPGYLNVDAARHGAWVPHPVGRS